MQLPKIGTSSCAVESSGETAPSTNAFLAVMTRSDAVIPLHKDPYAAILTLRHALALEFDASDQWSDLGEALWALGSHEAAQDAFEKALYLDPRNEAVRLRLVRMLCAEGYCLQAAKLCWDVLADDENNSSLQCALADALRGAGLSVQADKILAAAGIPALHESMNDAGQVSYGAKALQAGVLACMPSKEVVDRWSKRLALWSGIKVGLVWSGKGADAMLSSIPLEQFAPLADIPGITFFGLQKYAAAESMHPPDGMELIALNEGLISADDIGAAIMQMDLVISADPAVAELTASLGRPAWQLLSERSQQISTAAHGERRIFRQSQRGRWEPMMREVASALLKFLSECAAAGKLGETQARLLAARMAIDHYRLPEAERIYRELLANRAPTRQLLNALRLYMDRSGRYQILDPILKDAGNTDRGMLDWVSDLRAHALMKQGKRDKAYELWDVLVARGVPPLAILIHYAQAAHAERDWERAARIWEKAVTLYPQTPQALFGAAFTYAESGASEKAISCFQRGLGVAPFHPMAHHRLGCLLRAKGDKEQALKHMQKALYLDPGHASGWEHLGHLLYNANSYRVAAACFEQAVSIHPSRYAYSHLGFCAYLLNEHAVARPSFDQALSIDPTDREVLYYKALNLDRLDLHEEAVDAMEALRLADPIAFDQDDSKRKNLFIMHLKLQSAGASRPASHVYWSARRFNSERWTGQSLMGKTLLVYQDSGFGDSIQAARFYSDIRQEYGAQKIILAVWPELIQLYQGLAGVDEVLSIYANGVDGAACDYYVDEYSLFLILGKKHWRCMTDSYLKADPDMTDKWKGLLKDDRNFRVGLVWSGNPAHPNDVHRSTKLEEWAPLADIPGISIYAIQKGTSVSQAYDAQALNLVTVGATLQNFADTAALMTSLDLIVSVDSAPAHLAGALGIPVWLILPAKGLDWRWYGQEDVSFWYSCMRLFRHEKIQERRRVIMHMCHELQRLATQRRIGKKDSPTYG